MHSSPTSATSLPNAASSAGDSSRNAELEMLRRLPARLGFADVHELLGALQEAFGLAAPKTGATPISPVAPVSATAPAAAADHVGAPAAAAPTAEAMIRMVLNRRLGAVSGLTAEVRQRQVAEREELIRVLVVLFEAGAGRAGGTTPAIRDSDVERVVSALRRSALVRQVKPAEIARFCAAEAESDEVADQLDPFQLRLVLAYHDDVPHEEFTQVEICNLRGACEEGDADAVRRWFAVIAAKRDVLPRGTTAFLKREIIRQWDLRSPVLEALVYEQVVLDVQMFGAIGWENSRQFYAQLARATGAEASPFLSFLELDEIEEAKRVTRAIGLTAAHARFLQAAAARSAQDLAQLEKRITDAAAARSRQPAEPAVAARSSAATDRTERGAPVGWRLRTV